LGNLFVFLFFGGNINASRVALIESLIEKSYQKPNWLLVKIR